MRIAAIGDRDTIAGFRLAGVRYAYSASGATDTKDALKKILGINDIAILFITADLYPHVSSQLSERRMKGEVYPIVVEIPPMSGEMKEDPIREIVRRAVGIDMEK